MTAWMLGVFLKATLLLVGLGVVAQLARRTAAATRHFVWTSGLAVLLLLPALAVLLPGWAPQWASDWAPDLLAPRRASVEEVPLSLWLVPSQRQRGDLSPVTEDAAPAGTSAADPVREVAAEEKKSPAAESVVATSNAGKMTRGHRVASAVAPWLLATWIAGALLMASWLAVGLVRRARLARGARALDDGALVDAGKEVARALDLRRRVKLLLGDAPFVPMTWGVARPVLYLPAAAQGWSPRRLRTVLMHELAHIKRNDSLSRLLAQMACSVFWFHPLAWAAAGRMLREQERACDDVVIVAGADPHDYAETLLQMAREFRPPRPCVVGALAFSRRSNLEHRLLSILDPLARRKDMSMIRKAVMATAIAAAALPLAALRPAVAVPAAAPRQMPRLSITQEQEGGQLRLTAQGARRIPAAVDDIELEPDGLLTIEQGGRRLEVRRVGDNEPTFIYAVDGVDRPFDEAARQWADGVLARVGDLSNLDGLEESLGQLELALEPLELSLGQLDAALEPLELSLAELQDLEMPQIDLELPPVDLEPLELSLSRLQELEIPPADLSSLELSLVELENLELSLARLEDLELQLRDLPDLELPLAGLSHLETSLANLHALRFPTVGMNGFDWMQAWRDDESRVTVMTRGDVEIGATVDDIAVKDDGELVVLERGPDGRRRLHVYADGDGNRVFEWYVDGEETPFDDAARAWLRPILERLR